VVPIVPFPMAYPSDGVTTMIRTMLIGSLAGLALLAAPATAQGRGNSGKVPPGHLPPAGACRVWIDGVPPGRQPGVTSCANAHRTAARYGDRARVIYGDDYARRGNGKSKGKYKGRDRNDDRYGRRDRDDDRRDRDGRYGDRDDRTCVDNNRDGRCDSGVTLPSTRDGRTTTTRDDGTFLEKAREAARARAERERNP
jgi:hypothetical protein